MCHILAQAYCLQPIVLRIAQTVNSELTGRPVVVHWKIYIAKCVLLAPTAEPESFRNTSEPTFTLQLGAAPGNQTKELIPGNDSDRPTSESQ